MIFPKKENERKEKGNKKVRYYRELTLILCVNAQKLQKSFSHTR